MSTPRETTSKACGQEPSGPHMNNETINNNKQLQCKQFLTQQDDDADEDRDDGARPQAGRRHGAEGGAVAMFVAGTHLYFDDRPVG